MSTTTNIAVAIQYRCPPQVSVEALPPSPPPFALSNAWAAGGRGKATVGRPQWHALLRVVHTM
eukprot:2435761-Rhodomonas_salina.1